MSSRVLTVSSLSNYIKNVFEDELILHDVSLMGEIYEFKVTGNRTYVTLKEDNSIMSCVRFASTENFEIGATVVLFGTVSFSPKTAKVSFVFKSIKLTGEGNYARQLKELKDRLNLEGLFVSKYKLPTIIKKIAVITSAEGAVIHDVVSVLEGHSFMPDLDIYSVKVQGEDAPTTISSALKGINAKTYDAVMIARGGGGAEDLKAFNSEVVARAVYECGLPTISAVGHETDYTLCDFCATHRAGTPSIAAQKIVDINMKAYSDIVFCVKNIQRNVYNAFNSAKHSASFYLQKSMEILRNAANKGEEKLFVLSKNMHSVLKGNISLGLKSLAKESNKIADKTIVLTRAKENEFLNTVSILERTNPLKLLKSGYAMVQKEKASISSVNAVEIGDMLDIVLVDGTLKAQIKSKSSFKE